MPGPIQTASINAPMNTETPSAKNWHIPFSAAIGGGTGGYLCYPFEGLKKKYQSGQKISFHPLELYRGSSAFSMSVTTATVASMTFQHLLKSMPGYDHTSSTWEAASAVASGMLGACIGSTPVENIILTQQLNQTGPSQAVRILLKQGIARPWLGLPELMVREAGFAGTMLWAGKAARTKAYELTDSEMAASGAEIAAAVGGAIGTQPADTVATKKQHANGDFSSRQAIQAIYRESGMRGFFRGGSQRVFLFTGCAIIIPRMESIVKNFLKDLS